MATVTITITDAPDNMATATYIAVPPMPTENDEDFTVAQKAAVMALAFINETLGIREPESGPRIFDPGTDPDKAG